MCSPGMSVPWPAMPATWPPAAVSGRPDMPAARADSEPAAQPWPLVQVLAFPGCPNRDAAIALAERVCQELGCNAEIQVLDVADQQAAERTRCLGSPTIRIDGRDVEPGAAQRVAYTHSCRLYPGGQSLRGLPDVRWVREALRAARRRARRSPNSTTGSLLEVWLACRAWCWRPGRGGRTQRRERRGFRG